MTMTDTRSSDAPKKTSSAPKTQEPKTQQKNSAALDQVLRDRQHRLKGYRERALQLHPHVCAKCGREFSGKKLPELTVHHKDHNHDNNPPDGSNWELLCLYCHDNEHSRELDSEWLTTGKREKQEPVATHTPLAGLAALLKR